MSNSALVSYTQLSPNCNVPRNDTIKKITIHHMAGNMSLQSFGNLVAQPSRGMSSNYAIDSNGNIGLYCDESNRSWCSSSPANDHEAITIEVANDEGAPDWGVSEAALNATINLCVDICQRNSIPSLNFTGNANGNLTQHNYFSATACPGPYLKSKFQYIADMVNARLNVHDYTPEEFIEEIAVFVKKYAPSYNVKANSAVIAQGFCEGGYGNSDLAKAGNNHHGLKYRAGRCPTAIGIYTKSSAEFVNGVWTTKTSDFLTFKNMEDGVIGYFDFTNISAYNALKGETDPQRYLEKIIDVGYATDPNYVAKCMAVIEEYNLTRFDTDEETPVTPVVPYVPDELKIGYASAGDVALITRLLTDLAIPYTTQDGYIYTTIKPSVGDYNRINAYVTALLGEGKCVPYDPEPTLPTNEVEELKAKLAEVEALAEEYINKYSALQVDYQELLAEIKELYENNLD